MEEQAAITNRKILEMKLPLVLCLALIAAASPILNSAAYGNDQSSSFQAEAATIDNMPAKKVKVGDIDMAYKQLGNSSTNTPIVLITGSARLWICGIRLY